MDISIVIVNWNAKDLLRECLASLVGKASGLAVEVIIVDNASTDGSAEMVEREYPAFRLIRSDSNLGFAAANNLAIKQSSGKYVALVNSDIKVLPGCLEELCRYLGTNPEVGCVGPPVLNPDLTVQDSCRYFPGIWNNLCSASGLATAFPKCKALSGEHMIHFAHDRVCRVEALVGCFWMVRRAAFKEVGLLDEEFFMYAEDADWCRRSWRAGWPIVFVPSASVIHYRGGSSGGDPVRWAVAQQESVRRYWKKHHGTTGVLAITALLFVRHLIRLGYITVTRLTVPNRAAVRSVGLGTKACLKALLTPSAEPVSPRRLQ